MQLCTKTISIKPGYGAKTVLSFPGEGHQTVHGTVSDLFFCIEELPHLSYTRKDDDLVFTKWITLAEALDCPSQKIKTLDGRTISVGVDSLIRYSPHNLVLTTCSRSKAKACRTPKPASGATFTSVSR
jgi:DnaJ-class molecular chaperone